MQLTKDRSRQLAAVMFAALMLQACDTTNDTQTAAKVDKPATGIGDPNSPIVDGQLTAEQEWETKVGNTVEFATDAYDLSPKAQTTLQRQAQWLLQYPARTAVVEGHADERGTREYNLALGERRAQSAQAYLIALGVDASRLQTTSFGKEQPLCAEASDDCWQRNRRAVTALNP
ncbi:peptidoglycan-associated lipoprotein Pal [Dongia rigui]|uniref:Peptidoglycan-associated lipoprotein n=1 Tax=Dongia rigui TaxID=940149 RepID=A0ABU5E0Z3_9PROT|nr:peptidoglycan-associated lipoprotein Pal [Dongia rigui]MDY0873269.1 peptidoglycan-associated lipoprotein Pal [Dongia rigui]